MDTLEYVAARYGVPQSQVYSVATFYALFTSTAGTHHVAICRGTACHTAARGLCSSASSSSSACRGQRRRRTSHPDDAGSAIHDPNRRLLRPVRARPVVEVDHAIRGHVKEQALIREVEACAGPRAMMIKDFAAFSAVREAVSRSCSREAAYRRRHGHLRLRQRAEAVYNAFSSEIDARGLAVQLVPVGCSASARGARWSTSGARAPLLICTASSRTTSTRS